MRAPERMGLNDLLRDTEIIRARQLQQNHRHIAGDAEAPQARLAAPVRCDDAGIGPQPGVGIQDPTGEAFEDTGISLGGTDAQQCRLTVFPRVFEQSVACARRAAPARERNARGSRSGHAAEPVDRARVASTEHERNANCGDRVQHGADMTRERLKPQQRLRF